MMAFNRVKTVARNRLGLSRQTAQYTFMLYTRITHIGPICSPVEMRVLACVGLYHVIRASLASWTVFDTMLHGAYMG